jgi:phosphonate transport system substrate-binding protein
MAVSPLARAPKRQLAPVPAPVPDPHAPGPALVMRLARWIALVGLAASTLAGCASASVGATGLPAPTATVERAGAIVLGDIDPKTPARKIAELQPLADYLAAQLRPFGIRQGRVVVAPDEAAMARLLHDGAVDLYLGDTAPALTVCQRAGCDLRLRQWKGGQPAMAGLFVARRADGVERLGELAGRVIAVEKPHSAVGHVLPLAMLARHGLPVRQVGAPGAAVGPEEIGYYVAPGGRTAMDLLLRGQVAAAAMGERTLGQFSPAVRDQTAIVDRTIAIPSQLVALRPGLDRELAEAISALLVGLDRTPEGRAILTALRETERFDRLPPDAAALLDHMRAAMALTPADARPAMDWNRRS